MEIFGGHTQIATPARCFGVQICTAVSVSANLGRGSMFSAAGDSLSGVSRVRRRRGVVS